MKKVFKNLRTPFKRAARYGLIVAGVTIGLTAGLYTLKLKSQDPYAALDSEQKTVPLKNIFMASLCFATAGTFFFKVAATKPTKEKNGLQTG